MKERELREAEARAVQQRHITESELAITVQTNEGKAEYQRSIQLAEQTRAMAQAEGDKVRMLGQAEADKVRVLGEAEADRSARVGIAQAIAIEEQVRAYGGPKFQPTPAVMGRFAEAIEESKVDVVPKIIDQQRQRQRSGWRRERRERQRARGAPDPDALRKDGGLREDGAPGAPGGGGAPRAREP